MGRGYPNQILFEVCGVFFLQLPRKHLHVSPVANIFPDWPQGAAL